MKALVFKGIGRIQLEDFPIPEVREPDDVLIRVAMCGVCGTDLKILEGKHAFKEDTILGHEFCGVVSDIGDKVTSLRVGDRVAVENTLNCGVCAYCRSGLQSQCAALAQGALGVAKNGGFAEYCVAPERLCYRIPLQIDDLVGTQIETLSPVLNGLRSVQVMPWEYVLVVGFGPLGYLFASLCRRAAAKTAVAEVDPFRFRIAQEMGFPVFNPETEDLSKSFTHFSRGPKADVVIEAVGTELARCLDLLAPGGRVLHMGMDSEAIATIPPNSITRGAWRVLGCYLGHGAMLHSIRVLQEGHIDLSRFFTETIPLEDGLEAFPKLGLHLSTMTRAPKTAMKLVLAP